MRYNTSVPSYTKNEFGLRTTPYRGVLVNSAGVSSAVREEGANRRRNEEGTAGLCVSGDERSPWMAWCKPAILLLFVVLVIVLFVFVAGIVLYFNCK